MQHFKQIVAQKRKLETLERNNYSSGCIDVSVIIVNWNAGEYLEKTINSLREKTLDVSYEIIIVDNKSNKEDESYLFLEKLSQYDNVTTIENFLLHSFISRRQV